MLRLGVSCSPHSTESGQHRPSPFSIDAILSEDIGPRKPSPSPVGENPPSRPPWTSLDDAAALLKSPPTKNGSTLQPTHPAVPPTYQCTPTRRVSATPSYITSSPLNASFILNQSSSLLPPPDSICLDDSNLGILSTVACYHGELSSSGSLTEKVEALRVHSTASDTCSLNRVHSLLEASSSSMPCILKRDRKRQNKMSSIHGKAVLNSSPSALYKTPNKPIMKDNTFSPSIFLSHPNGSSNTSTSSATQGHTPFHVFNSPRSEAESTGKNFVTSTPIRMEEKENAPCVSPFRPAKRKLLDENSDVDVAARKPRLFHRNSKARTKLSPLLENSCSPISKSLPQLSRLSPPAPLREHNGSISGVAPSPHNLSSLSSMAQPNNHKAFHHHHHQHHGPTAPGTSTKLVSPSALIQSSPVTSQLNRTGQIQSVPPWFIFSTKSESKRSRLAEAINRSLTERTPTQATSKLPHGWIKLACGQTDDQIRLTEEARSFLRRPRQLTFDNIPPA